MSPFIWYHLSDLFRSTDPLTYVLVGQRSSSIAPKASSVPSKAPTVPSKAPTISSKAPTVPSEAPSVPSEAPTIPSETSTSIATDASVSVTIRYTGKLVSIVEPVAVVVGEVSVGVAIREPVSLGDTHNTQTPELVYKRNTDRREQVSGYILL